MPRRHTRLALPASLAMGLAVCLASSLTACGPDAREQAARSAAEERQAAAERQAAQEIAERKAATEEARRHQAELARFYAGEDEPPAAPPPPASDPDETARMAARITASIKTTSAPATQPQAPGEPDPIVPR